MGPGESVGDHGAHDRKPRWIVAPCRMAAIVLVPPLYGLTGFTEHHGVIIAAVLLAALDARRIEPDGLGRDP